MLIRMVQERTGPRWDGRPWPPVGGEIVVSDEEGAAVCAAGWAIPVAVPEPTPKPKPKPVTPAPKPETPEDHLKVTEEQRGAPPAETPAEAAVSDSGSPAVNDPKGTWVAHAVGKGAATADAEAMTKQQLIDRYGG